MFHTAWHAVPETDLFTDWTEARALWLRIVGRVPGLVALFLMPNHLHLLTRQAVSEELHQAGAAFAQWRNRRRGEAGPVWLPASTEEVRGKDKQRRSVRYVHLQACRARLQRDPLSWPFSTHRDAVGLALEPVIREASDPFGFHRYVSSDPTAVPAGSELPQAPGGVLRGERGVALVGDAVSALMRLPRTELHRRGPARSLWIGAARALVDVPLPELTELVGVTRATPYRTPRPPLGTLRLVERVCGDPRFAALDERLPFRPRQPWRVG